MAVAAYSYQTCLIELKTLIRDVENKWMTDLWYKSKIFEHFVSNKVTTYSFPLRATGVWSYRTDGKKIMLYDMSFTGLADVEYQVNCNGSIEATSGTDETDPHTVSGTEVNYPELIVDVCQYLITHKSQDEAASVGATSFTPTDESRLITIMEYWRGIRAL